MSATYDALVTLLASNGLSHIVGEVPNEVYIRDYEDDICYAVAQVLNNQFNLLQGLLSNVGGVTGVPGAFSTTKVLNEDVNGVATDLTKTLTVEINGPYTRITFDGGRTFPYSGEDPLGPSYRDVRILDVRPVYFYDLYNILDELFLDSTITSDMFNKDASTGLTNYTLDTETIAYDAFYPNIVQGYQRLIGLMAFSNTHIINVFKNLMSRLALRQNRSFGAFLIGDPACILRVLRNYSSGSWIPDQIDVYLRMSTTTIIKITTIKYDEYGPAGDYSTTLRPYNDVYTPGAVTVGAGSTEVFQDPQGAGGILAYDGQGPADYRGRIIDIVSLPGLPNDIYLVMSSFDLSTPEILNYLNQPDALVAAQNDGGATFFFEVSTVQVVQAPTTLFLEAEYAG